MVVPGGVNENGQPYLPPVLERLIAELSNCFQMSVFCGGSYGNENLSYRVGAADVHYIHTGSPSGVSASIQKGLGLFSLIRKHYTVEPFNVIHGFGAIPTGFLSILASKWLRVPSVITLQGGELAAIPEIKYGNMLKWRHRVLTKYVVTRTSRLIMLTRHQERLLPAFGLSHPNYYIIPFGVDVARFKPLPIRRLTKPFRFIHVANLTPVKDQITLLKAFASMSQSIEVELRIIGPDYYDGELHKLASQLGISGKVRFLGEIPNRELPEHYEWAHMMLHPSIHEGQGVVCLEAACMGVAVCGTRVGIISDLSPLCFATVDPGDHEALAERAISILSNPVEYYRMAREAQDWAISHDLSWTVGKYAGIYRSLLV